MLHIKNFGHFRNYSLPLGQNNLTIIYGENEAGKSTLTHFFKHLMLGMPVGNKYQYYLSSSQKGGYGQGKLDNGIAFKLASYKRKQKLRPTITALDPMDQNSAEEGFTALIKTIGDQVYKNLFACTTQDFHNTSEFLKEKDFKEFLSQFLIGGQNPKVLIKSLNSQAEEYFNSVKGKKKLKKIKENIGNLKVEMSAKELKSSDYYEKKEAYEEANQKCEEIVRKISDKKHRINLLKLYSEWLEENRRKEEAQLNITSLNPPKFFPPAGLTRMREQQESLEKKDKLLAGLRKELNGTQDKIQNLQCNQAIIALADKVKYLEINSKEARRLINKMPELKNESEQLAATLQKHLYDLGPDWNPSDFKNNQLSAIEKSKLDGLSQKFVELTQKAATTDASLGGHKQKQTQLETQKSVLDSGLISKQELQEQEDFFNNQALDIISRQEELTDLCEEINTICRTLFAELSYESTDFKSIKELVAYKLPDISQIEEFANKHKNISGEQNSIKAQLTELTNRKSNIQRTLELARAEAGIEDLNLPDLREARTLGWKLIKEKIHLLEEEKTVHSQLGISYIGDHPNLETAFETVLDKIDFLTDKIVENHELVGMERELAELISKLEEKSSHLDSLLNEEANLIESWKILWEDVPLTPMLPHLMLEWRKNLSKLRIEHANLQLTKEKHSKASLRLETWNNDIQKYLPSNNGKLSIKEKFRSFLAEQNRKHAVMEKLEQEHLEIKALISKCQGDIQLLDKELQKTMYDWDSLWSKTFPNKEMIQVGDWNTFILALEKAFFAFEEYKQEQKKISLNQAEIHTFTSILKEVCDGFALAYHENAVIASLENALRIFEENASAHKELEALNIKLKHICESIRQQESESTTLRTQISNLLSDANCEDEQSFFKAGDAYQKAAPYIKTFDNACSNLMIIEAKIKKTNDNEHGHKKHELGKLQSGSIDDMQVEQDLLSEQSESKHLEQKLKASFEDLAEKKLQFQSLDGSEDVSYYRSEITSKESEFKDGLLDYLSLKLGATILTRVLERFETKTHPEFIKLASSYLSAITADKYQEISEEDDEYYIERSSGSPLAVSELSTGTLEQLYLSMRLAAMDQLASRGETLPFILDDILANSDYKRAARAIRAISKLSHKTQIIYLTCHASFVETVKSSLNYGSYDLIHLQQLH